MKKILLIVLVMLLSGCANAAVSVRLEDGAVLLDDRGTAVVPLGAYEDIIPLEENLFAAAAGKLCALMNERGELLTEMIYDEIRPASSVLMASENGLWGLLSRNGAEILAPAYTRLTADGTGAFWALKSDPDDAESDALYLVHADGTERESALRVRRMAAAPGCGLIAVQMSSGLWGYCDAAGDLAIPAEYESAGVFRAGLAPVAQNGLLGAVDLQGNMVVPAQYESMEITVSGSALAGTVGEGVQVFGADGSLQASYPGAETFAAAFGDGYAIYEPDQLRVFDGNGAQLITASGLAAVSEGLNGQILLSDGAWGETCVSIAGTEAYYQNLYPLGMAGEKALYACMSVSASRYMNEALGEMQLAVDMDSARFGVADERGELCLPMEYESVQYLGDDRLLVSSGGLWQVMDSSGRVFWSHGAIQSEAPSF